MPFIPVPNGIQLCFDFVTDNQNWQFCFMLRKTAGSPTPADLAARTADGASWWTATLKPLLVAANTLRQVRATDMTTQGGPQNLLPVNTTGTSAGSPAGLGTPLVMSLRTALRGRSYRGRIYISGFSAGTMVDSVNTTSANALNLGSAVAALVTTVGAAGFPMVIASRQHNGIVTNPAQTNVVTAVVVDVHTDSQRRRLFGRGT